MQIVPHIVAVDDHSGIRNLVGRYLEQQGYKVSHASSGAMLRQIIEHQSADLILNIKMPGEDSLSVCRRLRASGDVPVIFLTAMADDTDRIIGLELGADDYLVKPFYPRELIARICAVLRRAVSAPGNRSLDLAKRLRVGHRGVDVGSQELAGNDGVAVSRNTAEFRLLKAFNQRPGLILIRDRLLDLTVGRAAYIFDRSIGNQVSRLRKKIEADLKNPSIIKARWCGGYSLSIEGGLE